MWFLPCVNPHVTLKTARFRKCLVTFIAAMWFLSWVDPHVTLQTARSIKCLVTFIAGIHSLHVYGFSPVWILMCLFRCPGWENVRSHSLQKGGFSPVWILMCIFRGPNCEILGHIPCRNVVSPLCGSSCASSDCYDCYIYRICLVTFIADIYGFSPVWILLCLFRLLE